MTNELLSHNSYKTECAKGRDGWEATSEAQIGQTTEGPRILKLRTSKTRGGVAASASVCIRSYCEATGFTSETYNIFGGYSKSGIAMAKGRRGTEKAIREVHAQALLEMETLIAEATAFYEARDAEAA